MLLPRAVSDKRRDRIPRHLVLQANASQGHEDVPGCVQPAAPHLHVEPEVEVVAYDVGNEPQLEQQLTAIRPCCTTHSRSITNADGRWPAAVADGAGLQRRQLAWKEPRLHCLHHLVGVCWSQDRSWTTSSGNSISGSPIEIELTVSFSRGRMSRPIP